MLDAGRQAAAALRRQPQPRLQGLYAAEGYEDRDGDGARVWHAAALGDREYKTLPADDRHGHGRAGQLCHCRGHRAPGRHKTVGRGLNSPPSSAACRKTLQLDLPGSSRGGWAPSGYRMNSSHRLWPALLDYGLLVLGSILQGIGLRLFLVPAHLANGGVTGISQWINYYTNWPIGLMVLIGNVPLFLLGWR